MQIKNKPEKELLLVHQDCLKQTPEFKSRIGYNPRGKWKAEAPCYCGICKAHFEDEQMTFWLFRDKKPSENE